MTFLAQLADSGSNFGHMDWNGGWWMMIFWTPLLIVGLAAILAAVLRSGGLSSQHRSEDQDPLVDARRILAERYARGELDSVEYRERVDQLD